MCPLYQARLANRFRNWRQPAEPRHRVALAPPGLLSDPRFTEIIDSLTEDFSVLFSHGADQDVVPLLETGKPRLIVLSSGKGFPLISWQVELLHSALTESCYWIAEYPFWFDVPGSDKGVELAIDNRFFRYNDDELQQLLKSHEIGIEASRWLTPHDLRALSGAWPGITDAALQDIAARRAIASTDLAGGRAQFAIAQLDRVKTWFTRYWLPLLQRRCPCLTDLSALPLLTMDLLADVFANEMPAIREGLLAGWLERCPGTVGEYRLDTTLDQLLRESVDIPGNTSHVEAAVVWYQRNGFLAEAVETAVMLGMSLTQLQEMWPSGVAGSQAESTRSRYASIRKGMGTGAMIAQTGAGFASAGMPAKVSAILSNRVKHSGNSYRPGTSGSGVDAKGPAGEINDAVAHLLHAINLHQGYNWAEVTEAIRSAINSGFERQRVGRLVDFVDVHMRPLLHQDRSAISQTIRKLNHSSPARASLAKPTEKLNHRELQILQRIYEGYKNSEISEQLGLEISTVKWYGTRIYEKLGVSNRTQAALKARKLKLVE